MKKRTGKTYQFFQTTICLLGLLAFVFFPSLHKLEHALEDAANHHSLSHYTVGNCSEPPTTADNRGLSKPAHPSEAAGASATHHQCGRWGEDCQQCRELHLLSLNSLTLPAANVLSSAPPAENQHALYFRPSEAMVLPAKRACAPPYPHKPS